MIYETVIEKILQRWNLEEVESWQESENRLLLKGVLTEGDEKKPFALKVVRKGEKRSEGTFLKILKNCDGIVQLLEEPHTERIQGEEYEFLLEEFGEKVTIQELLELPPNLRISFIKDLLEALKNCENHGVLHGDVKPDNVLRFHGEYRLVDFSISQYMDFSEPLSSTGNLGTPAYSPPELWRKGQLNHTTDTYCVGLILYQLFNWGELPPSSRLSGKEQAPPATGGASLAKVILQGIHFSPERRFTSAGHFLEELERAERETIHILYQRLSHGLVQGELWNSTKGILFIRNRVRGDLYQLMENLVLRQVSEPAVQFYGGFPVMESGDLYEKEARIFFSIRFYGGDSENPGFFASDGTGGMSYKILPVDAERVLDVGKKIGVLDRKGVLFLFYESWLKDVFSRRKAGIVLLDLPELETEVVRGRKPWSQVGLLKNDRRNTLLLQDVDGDNFYFDGVNLVQIPYEC